jgi:hypothetical protein
VRHGNRACCKDTVGESREDYSRRAGKAIVNVPQQGCAIHSWHPHVGDYNIEGVRLTGLQGGFSTDSKLHVPAIPIRMEQAPDTIEDIDFIVYE